MISLGEESQENSSLFKELIKQNIIRANLAPFPEFINPHKESPLGAVQPDVCLI